MSLMPWKNPSKGCPAHAGIDRAIVWHKPNPMRLPRLRGDRPDGPLVVSEDSRVAPPTRG